MEEVETRELRYFVTLAEELHFRERAAMLRDGRADVGLPHSPQDDLTGLDAEELLTQHQVVLLPERHPLAQRASVCLADLDGETMPRWPGMPGGNGTGPLVRDISQLMQLIVVGRTVAVVPESAALGLGPARLAVRGLDRPVTDAPAGPSSSLACPASAGAPRPGCWRQRNRRVVQLLVNVDENGVVLDPACVNRDGPAGKHADGLPGGQVVA